MNEQNEQIGIKTPQIHLPEETQEKTQNGTAVSSGLSTWNQYLRRFGYENYCRNDSSREISLDPESHGFTVSLIECSDLQKIQTSKVPSLVKYCNHDTKQVLFYFHGLSGNRESKVTLLDAFPELDKINFKEKQCLLVSFEENPEIHREILKKKAHAALSKQTLAAGLLLTLIEEKYLDLPYVIRLQNDQIALLFAVSRALKEPENYDTDYLLQAVVISDVDAAIRFAISRGDLLLFNFLEKKCVPINLDVDQQRKVSWLRQINDLQQQVKKNFLPELLARFVWYRKQSQQLRHEQKDFIKGKGALSGSLNQLRRHSPITAILEGTYYESSNIEKRKVLAQKIADQLTAYTDYRKTPLMAPLIHLLALNMLIGPGGAVVTSKLRKYRPLEILITTDARITALSPYILSEKHDASGEYSTNGNTLLVSLDEAKDIKAGICTLLHEAAHLAANEVYQHSAQPYRKRDFSRKKRYQSLKATILNQIDNWLPHSQKESILIEQFRKLLRYKDEHITAELFVRVPEALFILGYEQGLSWLNQHAPDLLKLYEEEFLPDCLQYLKYRQINAQFSLDPSFASVLQTTSSPELSLVLSKREIRMLKLSVVAFAFGIMLAIVTPTAFTLGLALIVVAAITPLTIAIKFHQVTAGRLAAMEFEPLPIANQPTVVRQHSLDGSIKPFVFSRSNSQQVPQTDNLETDDSLGFTP